MFPNPLPAQLQYITDASDICKRVAETCWLNTCHIPSVIVSNLSCCSSISVKEFLQEKSEGYVEREDPSQLPLAGLEPHSRLSGRARAFICGLTVLSRFVVFMSVQSSTVGVSVALAGSVLERAALAELTPNVTA